MAKTGRPRGLYSAQIGRARRHNVPLTREGLSYLKLLRLRFIELGTPIAYWSLIDLSMARLFREYGRTDKIHAQHPGSLEMLNARWIEFIGDNELAKFEMLSLMTNAPRRRFRYSPEIGRLSGHNVALTSSEFDHLRQLSSRFVELQRPLPMRLILEFALQRLFHEYCLYANKPEKNSPPSTQAIVKHGGSPEILCIRSAVFENGASLPEQLWVRGSERWPAHQQLDSRDCH
jgi:hypothetical protein